MTKAILIAVSDGFGGYGDFLFALKLSDQLKNHYRNKGEIPLVYIITQPTGKQKIIDLNGDVEFDTPILTPAELKILVESKAIDIGSLIEGPAFKSELFDEIDNALATVIDPIPLTMLPEYGFGSTAQELAIVRLHQEYRQKTPLHIVYTNTVFSGFNHGEHGILLSDRLLTPAAPDELVHQLDIKISELLIGASQPVQSIEHYQDTTALFFQYSHDQYQDRHNAKTGRNPVEHFLRLHQAFVKCSEKNQDIILVGEHEYLKLNALKSIQSKLMDDGFERISFYNLDTQTELILHNSRQEGKTYRAIYTRSMSHSSMIACMALSGVLVGATGDQSFSEAISSNKVIIYECLAHKENLINSYDAAMIDASGNDLEIAALLNAINDVYSDDEYALLAKALSDKYAQLKQLNISVLKNYDFIAAVINAIELGLDLNHHLHVVDANILRSATGFYKIASKEIGHGGWSSAHEASFFSIGIDGLQVDREIVIKKMGANQTHLLEKECTMLKKAYPTSAFEQFTIEQNAYLSMPYVRGTSLDTYLQSHPQRSQAFRQAIAIALLNDVNAIHLNDITHNDIKPKNIIYNPISNEVKIIDFGCAETIGTIISYQGIETAKYAIEYMPPEYLEADNPVTCASDIYSMALTLAEIFGMDIGKLVRERMEKTLASIDNHQFKTVLHQAFSRCKSLDMALFSPSVCEFHAVPDFLAFIKGYSMETYDFSSYETIVGYNVVALLYAMQKKKPQDRPNVTECIHRLQNPGPTPLKISALMKALQAGHTHILATEKERRPWFFANHEALELLHQMTTNKASKHELEKLMARCSSPTEITLNGDQQDSQNTQTNACGFFAQGKIAKAPHESAHFISEHGII